MKNYRIADSEDDIENLHSLINAAYRGESSKLGWTTEADLLGGQRIDAIKIRELIEDSRNKILVIDNPEIENDPLACVLLTKLNSNKFYLGMLTVRPQFQSRGLGSQLIRAAENEAKTLMPSNLDAKIEMTVIAQRKELIEWYFKKGFNLTGEKRPFPYGDTRFGIPKREDLFFLVLEKKII